MKKFVSLFFLLFFSCNEPLLVEDCAGVVGGNTICGCMDASAVNYLSEATFDDETCVSIEKLTFESTGPINASFDITKDSSDIIEDSLKYIFTVFTFDDGIINKSNVSGYLLKGDVGSNQNTFSIL